MMRVEIYTDGAADRASKRGGWAWVMRDKDEFIDKSGAETDTNVNRMKMTAMIHAAERLMGSRLKPDEVVFYSDCEYCIDVFSEKYQVLRHHRNYDLICRFIAGARVLEGRGTTVRLEWIKAGSGNPFIDRADAAARVEMAGKQASANLMGFFDHEAG
jgi:ribonuclease HI